jgi:hypothetical protein
MSESRVRFDAATAKAICDEVGNVMVGCDAAQLAADLDSAGQELFDELGVEQRLKAYPQVVDMTKALNQAAQRLRGAFDEGPSDSVTDSARSLLQYHVFRDRRALDVGKEHQLARYQEAVDGVKWMARWLQITVNTIESEDWNADAKIRIVEEFIGRTLPSIYQKHTNQRFGVSKPSTGIGPAYGPGVRFLQAVLNKLNVPGVSTNADALVKRMQRYEARHKEHQRLLRELGNGTRHL